MLRPRRRCPRRRPDRDVAAIGGNVEAICRRFVARRFARSRGDVRPAERQLRHLFPSRPGCRSPARSGVPRRAKPGAGLDRLRQRDHLGGTRQRRPLRRGEPVAGVVGVDDFDAADRDARGDRQIARRRILAGRGILFRRSIGMRPVGRGDTWTRLGGSQRFEGDDRPRPADQPDEDERNRRLAGPVTAAPQPQRTSRPSPLACHRIGRGLLLVAGASRARRAEPVAGRAADGGVSTVSGRRRHALSHTRRGVGAVALGGGAQVPALHPARPRLPQAAREHIVWRVRSRSGRRRTRSPPRPRCLTRATIDRLCGFAERRLPR